MTTIILPVFVLFLYVALVLALIVGWCAIKDLRRKVQPEVTNMQHVVINDLSYEAHQTSVNKGFWDGQDKNDPRVLGMKLALIHSEVSELLEIYRESHGAGEAEEMADIVIRVMDLAAARGVDLGRAIVMKMAYNATRPHKHGEKAF